MYMDVSHGFQAILSQDSAPGLIMALGRQCYDCTSSVMATCMKELPWQPGNADTYWYTQLCCTVLTYVMGVAIHFWPIRL